MRASTLTAVTAAVAAAAVVLAGCGSDTKTPTASSSSSSTTTATPTPVPPAPGETIDQYIKANQIAQTPMRPKENGAPDIVLPTPEGWGMFTGQLPAGAYGGIKYTGPDAAPDFPPTIYAYLSRLQGNIDAKTIFDVAPNDLQGLPDYAPSSPGAPSKFVGNDAFELAGTAQLNDRPTFLAQKTVVIPDKDGGLFLLQLNAVSTPEQQDILGGAMGHIENETTIN